MFRQVLATQFRDLYMVGVDIKDASTENKGVLVPEQILRFVDEGRNPESFLQDVFNSVTLQNQQTQGRTQAFQNLSCALQLPVSKTKPSIVS